jgi:predicted cupin superfamily sugar epimerase
MISGGRGDQKCRVGDESGTGTYIYLLMEQGPVTVSVWSRRTKRRRFHFFTYAPDRCSIQDEKGTRPLQQLVLCFRGSFSKY